MGLSFATRAVGRMEDVDQGDSVGIVVGPAPENPETSANNAAASGSAAKKEDPCLASISLPAAAVKRIVRNAAPGARFNAEALAALHRVAQAYVLFATDRALGEMKLEADKFKKTKGRSGAPPRKTMGAEHVMQFLSSELPQIATKVSNLFPDLMPTDFKPAGVRLLEQLHEQEKAAAADASAADRATTNAASLTPGDGSQPVARNLFQAFANAPSTSTAEGGPDLQHESLGADNFEDAQTALDVVEGDQGTSTKTASALKRPGASGDAQKKRARTDGTAGSKQVEMVPKAPPKTLGMFFNARQTPASATVPVAGASSTEGAPGPIPDLPEGGAAVPETSAPAEPSAKAQELPLENAVPSVGAPVPTANVDETHDAQGLEFP